MIAALVLATVIAQPSYYSPGEAEALFQQGATAFDQGDYDGAIAAWQKLADHGFASQDVLYNLGTAALKKGDLGHAVLWLERARRAGGPRDDVTANLEAARARQGDKVVGQVGDPFIERIAAASSPDLVAMAFLAAWLGGWALAFVFRFLKPGRRTWAAVLSALLLVASLPLGLLLGAHVWVEKNTHDAVVLSPTVQARELPAPNAKVSFEVHAGLKVRLLETEGAFVRIRLPNGLVGWAEKEGLAEL
ncbi:MAG: tetratricopeptide repeat protein [Myxococcaceae bacterium]|nr:tetratricopeptide repeat protein [Myxococcaceae bacterium]